MTMESSSELRLPLKSFMNSVYVLQGTALELYARLPGVVFSLLHNDCQLVTKGTPKEYLGVNIRKIDGLTLMWAKDSRMRIRSQDASICMDIEFTQEASAVSFVAWLKANAKGGLVEDVRSEYVRAFCELTCFIHSDIPSSQSRVGRHLRFLGVRSYQRNRLASRASRDESNDAEAYIPCGDDYSTYITRLSDEAQGL